VEFWNFALGNLFLWKSALSKNSKYTVHVSFCNRECNTIQTVVYLNIRTVLRGNIACVVAVRIILYVMLDSEHPF
jgi:hypothetical protein